MEKINNKTIAEAGYMTLAKSPIVPLNMWALQGHLLPWYIQCNNSLQIK